MKKKSAAKKTWRAKAGAKKASVKRKATAKKAPAKKKTTAKKAPAKRKAAGKKTAAKRKATARKAPAQEGQQLARSLRSEERSTPARRRLDAELVRRGLASGRERARALIAEHRVLVSGALADKAARLVEAGEPISVQGPPARFVGRGGEKLDAAIDRFAIRVEGRRALDAGASTGGFTDCLLQRGAIEVVAVDVGRGQLHERLRADPRVVNRERTNLRSLEPSSVGGPFPLVVADLSFISLRTVAAALVGQVEEGGDLVPLVKPQFEAGRAEASRVVAVS